MALYAAVKELGLHQDVLPVHDDFGIGGIDLTGTQLVHEDQKWRRLERIRRMGYEIDWQSDNWKGRRIDEWKLKYDDSESDQSTEFRQRRCCTRQGFSV